MAAEIIKVYKESQPAMRLIGRRYTNADRNEYGMFSHKWAECFGSDFFARLEKHATPEAVNEGAYIGICGALAGGGEGDFEYWIGMFFPEGTPDLEGFDAVDFPAAEVGVCWIKGTEPDIYVQSMQCYAELAAEGFAAPKGMGEMGRWWEFERYNCPRFTEPDADGNVVLDLCVYLKK